MRCHNSEDFLNSNSIISHFCLCSSVESLLIRNITSLFGSWLYINCRRNVEWVDLIASDERGIVEENRGSVYHCKLNRRDFALFGNQDFFHLNFPTKSLHFSCHHCVLDVPPIQL